MDDNVGKAVTGLIVAAIGAQTFVAYKHPRAYPTLGVWLALASGLLAAILAAWNISNQTLLNAIVSSGLVQDKASEVVNISKNLNVPLWIIMLPFCLASYNLLLFSLPHWLLEPEQSKTKESKE